MKTVFFLVLLFALAFSEITLMSGKERSIMHEAVALELEFHGSCAQFYTFQSTIQISSFTSPGCLPIQNSTVKPNDDLNNLNSHVLCTNILHGKKSIVRFVEIFSGTDDSATLAPGTTYIISLISSLKFRVLSSAYTYLRRPTCQTSVDFCNPATYIINTCEDHNLILNHGYADTTDRVYLVPQALTVYGCATSPGVCCSYIATHNGGICSGMLLN